MKEKKYLFIHYTYLCSLMYCLELKYVKKVKMIKVIIQQVKKKRILTNGIV